VIKKWRSISLADTCLLFTDGNWIESKDQSTNGIRLIQSGNIGNGFFKNRREKARWISQATFKRLKCQRVFSWDCLVSRLPDPVGRSCIIPETNDIMITAVDCSILRFNPSILFSRFFNYYSQSTIYLDDIESKCTGATRKRISRKNLGRIIVPCPSLPEQKRIVAILDKAFTSIDKAKVNAEKNLANARALFNSVRDSLFSNAENECNIIEFGDVIETLTDYHANGSYKVLKQHVELKDVNDYAWMVRSTDFEKNFENEMRYITKSSYDYLTKSRIFGGEIIMSKIGNAGKIYLMPKITRPCSLAMNLFLIRLNENKISNKYVYHYLKSKSGETQILSKLKGTATQTITKQSVRDLQIPLLPRNMQDRFVTQLEELENVTRQLESIYDQKILHVKKLKQSILKKAFTGELTAEKAETLKGTAA